MVAAGGLVGKQESDEEDGDYKSPAWTGLEKFVAGRDIPCVHLA
jgi:hypothetical protein